MSGEQRSGMPFAKARLVWVQVAAGVAPLDCKAAYLPTCLVSNSICGNDSVGQSFQSTATHTCIRGNPCHLNPRKFL